MIEKKKTRLSLRLRALCLLCSAAKDAGEERDKQLVASCKKMQATGKNSAIRIVHFFF